MFGAEWTVGWDGGGPGIAVWDTTKAWDAAGQPRGVVAAHIPQMPHFIRFDEVAAGRVNPRRLLRLPATGRPHWLRPGLGRQGLHRAAPGRERSASPTLHSDVSSQLEASRRWKRRSPPGCGTHGAVLGDTGSTPSFIATRDPAGSRPAGVASASASPTSKSSPRDVVLHPPQPSEEDPTMTLFERLKHEPSSSSPRSSPFWCRSVCSPGPMSSSPRSSPRRVL